MTMMDMNHDISYLRLILYYYYYHFSSKHIRFIYLFSFFIVSFEIPAVSSGLFHYEWSLLLACFVSRSVLLQFKLY